MHYSELLKQLNPMQKEAVEHTEGPVLVLAGAGSGKTRVLTYRIAYIIDRGLAAPHQILAVTFTNKAASEMKQRVEHLLDMPVNRMWIGTFHSISARILHYEARYAGYKSNFTIYDVEDQVNQIKRIMELLNISREVLAPKTVQQVISKAKNNLIDAAGFEKEATEFREKKIGAIFREYEMALRRNNAMDFDDLLIKPIDIFTAHPQILNQYQNRFKYILVDEYQDTNKAQYYWVKLLSREHRNICVVGDEDQSIYRWRGADIGNILSFEADFPNAMVIRLEQNYRSTETILKAANAVVSHNQKRLGKNLWSENGTGEQIRQIQAQNEVQEALKVVQIVREELAGGVAASYRDIVVLYRTNAQSRALEEQMRRNSIPYSIVGGQRFYERKEIKDAVAYLKVLVNPSDSVNLLRIVNFPTRGIGNTTLKAVLQFANQRQLNLFSALEQVDHIDTITAAAKKRIAAFVKLITDLRSNLESLNAYDLSRLVLEKSGLLKLYAESDRVEDESRMENINELLNSADIFVNNSPENALLQNFLDEISLFTDLDQWDAEQANVTLMTLHSAKGLEFPVVIITGLEDGLFPISRAADSEDDLEEERRLFYVGMTRAKKKLYLLHAQTRHRFQQGEFGMNWRSVPSRFLLEIPDEHKEIKSESRSYRPDPYRGFKREAIRRRQLAAELPDEESDFRIGQYVEHETFGRGQILGVDMSSLGTKLTIQFSNRQLKKLVAEYANLTICDP